MSEVRETSRKVRVGAPTQVVNIIVGTVVFFIAISAIFGYIKNLKKKPSDSKAQKEETK